MNIEYRDGLLFTSIEVFYKGKSKIIENIVIDTGASQTLISQDSVDNIGIKVSGRLSYVHVSGLKIHDVFVAFQHTSLLRFRCFLRSWAQLSGIVILRALFPFPTKRKDVLVSKRISFTVKSHSSCARAPLAYSTLSNTLSRFSMSVVVPGILRRTETSSSVKYESDILGFFF